MGTRKSGENSLSEQEFASAIEMLRQLLPEAELNRRQPCGPATVYTTMITLWMMTLQRLGGGKTLQAIVKDVLYHSRELLPDNKRCVKEPCRKPRGVCGRPDSTEAGDGGVLRQLRV